PINANGNIGWGKVHSIDVGQSGIATEHKQISYPLQADNFEVLVLYGLQLFIIEEIPIHPMEFELVLVKWIPAYPFHFHGHCHHLPEPLQMLHHSIVAKRLLVVFGFIVSEVEFKIGDEFIRQFRKEHVGSTKALFQKSMDILLRGEV